MIETKYVNEIVSILMSEGQLTINETADILESKLVKERVYPFKRSLFVTSVNTLIVDKRIIRFADKLKVNREV